MKAFFVITGTTPLCERNVISDWSGSLQPQDLVPQSAKLRLMVGLRLCTVCLGIFTATWLHNVLYMLDAYVFFQAGRGQVDIYVLEKTESLYDCALPCFQVISSTATIECPIRGGPALVPIGYRSSNPVGTILEETETGASAWLLNSCGWCLFSSTSHAKSSNVQFSGFQQKPCVTSSGAVCMNS